jgi:hypothetical protein
MKKSIFCAIGLTSVLFSCADSRNDENENKYKFNRAPIEEPMDNPEEELFKNNFYPAPLDVQIEYPEEELDDGYSDNYDLDCEDIGEEVWVGDYDPNYLDADGDGWGCESFSDEEPVDDFEEEFDDDNSEEELDD